MDKSPSDQENIQVSSSPSQELGQATDRTHNNDDMNKRNDMNILKKTVETTGNDSEDRSHEIHATSPTNSNMPLNVVEEQKDNGGNERDHSVAPDVPAETITDAKNDKPGDASASCDSSALATHVNDTEATLTTNNKSNNTSVDSVAETKGKEEVEVAPKKRTRKRWKKPVGKPNRPLSAYNLYFKKERARMLGDAAEKTEPEQGKKRVHRKTHGKIGFAEMARIIGAKWKTLSDDEKEEFVKVAATEKEKYAKDLANWREEQEKKRSIANSMGAGRKSKISKNVFLSGRGSDDDDDLIQAIAEDRERLIRQHQAFRLQMMQEMQVGRLGRLPAEGHGRPMPTLDYLRNMQDDRAGQYFGRNQHGDVSGLYSHYPSAAEGSGRDLYQQMAAMAAGPDGDRRDPDQFHQLKMARMQVMNSSMSEGPENSSMGGPMGAPMNNTMGNSMGMIPLDKDASHMPSTSHSHYEVERYHHMRYQNQMRQTNSPIHQHHYYN